MFLYKPNFVCGVRRQYKKFWISNMINYYCLRQNYPFEMLCKYFPNHLRDKD